jgi:hypothetical protein
VVACNLLLMARHTLKTRNPPARECSTPCWSSALHRGASDKCVCRLVLDPFSPAPNAPAAS